MLSLSRAWVQSLVRALSSCKLHGTAKQTNLQIINADEGVEKSEPSYTAGGNVNWYSLWRTVWRFLKKLKIELPYDPATPLLGIYPEKNMVQKDTCTPVFTAALFTIAET